MLNIDQEVSTLKQMSIRELADRYAELFGEPTRSRHRGYLIRKIAWKLQTLAEGDLSERARRRAEELAQGSELRLMPPRKRPTKKMAAPQETPADPRLPSPSNTIVRRYKGRLLEVLVLSEGFEFEGQRYPSLSAVAKAITGSHINGYRFFRLTSGRRREAGDRRKRTWSVARSLLTQGTDQSVQDLAGFGGQVSQLACLFARKVSQSLGKQHPIFEFPCRSMGHIKKPNVVRKRTACATLHDVRSGGRIWEVDPKSSLRGNSRLSR